MTEDNDLWKGLHLWIVGHTTVVVSDIQFVRSLCAEIGKLFPAADIWVRWVDEANSAKTARYSEFSDEQLQAVYCLGAICVADQAERAFVGGITWQRVQRERLRLFGRYIGWRQNEVSLRISGALLKPDPFRGQFVECALNIASLFNVNYLYAYDRRQQNAVFSSKSGIGVGLKDLYWLNVFGAPYVSMLGKEKLLTIPAYRVEEIESDRVFIQATDMVQDPDESPFCERRRIFRDHLGDEYFAKDVESGNELEAGVYGGPIGLLRFLRLLWREHREFEKERERADKCPVFDWSGIIVED